MKILLITYNSLLDEYNIRLKKNNGNVLNVRVWDINDDRSIKKEIVYWLELNQWPIPPVMINGSQEQRYEHVESVMDGYDINVKSMIDQYESDPIGAGIENFRTRFESVKFDDDQLRKFIKLGMIMG